MDYWLWMVLLALICWGGNGFTQKLATNRISARLSTIWFVVGFIPASVLIVLTTGMAWNYPPKILALAVLGGALIGLGTLPIFIALEQGGKASIVIPLVALYPLLTVLLAFAFLGERLTGRQWAGVCLASIAGLLLSQESSEQ